MRNKLDRLKHNIKYIFKFDPKNDNKNGIFRNVVSFYIQNISGLIILENCLSPPTPLQPIYTS